MKIRKEENNETYLFMKKGRGMKKRKADGERNDTCEERKRGWSGNVKRRKEEKLKSKIMIEALIYEDRKEEEWRKERLSGKEMLRVKKGKEDDVMLKEEKGRSRRGK